MNKLFVLLPLNVLQHGAAQMQIDEFLLNVPSV